MSSSSKFLMLTERLNNSLNYLTNSDKLRVIDAVVDYKANGTEQTELPSYLLSIFHLVLYSQDLEEYIEGI